jgi:4-amino-4-deoxy-L-arabinose transferase-like glycosyltransferase
VAVYALYFYRLDAAGLLGPDEPRYASIARQMAQSGDWITPRLWGEPWFEKPVLLYWMSAVGFSAGLNQELAPRLPVAILSAAFLAFFYWRLRREFGPSAAAYSTAILGAGAGWLAFSHVAVTDLPLAASFSAAVLLALPWAVKGERRLLPWASASLGLAVLAKGLGPLVLFLPVLWTARRRWRDLLGWRVWLPLLAVAAPWYLLCWARHGRPFIDELFLKHHFGRFTSDYLRHEQPFWFFLPVLLAGLVPWTPLVFRRRLWFDARTRCLALVVIFGFVFFSISRNKLPGYVLPLVPSLAALAGAALAREPLSAVRLAACGLLLAAFPIAADILPVAVARGLSRAAPPVFHWTWLAPLPVATGAFWLARKGKTGAAVAAVATGCVLGVLDLKTRSFPVLDAQVSARSVWLRIAPCASRWCVGTLHRSMRYGLNYYSVEPLPNCGPHTGRHRLEGDWMPAQASCESLTALREPL